MHKRPKNIGTLNNLVKMTGIKPFIDYLIGIVTFWHEIVDYLAL